MLNIEKISEDNREKLIELIKKVTLIPSPSYQEKERADFCVKYLKSLGYTNIEVDEINNVILKFEGNEEDMYTVFMAHIDTVFSPDTKLEIKEDSENIYCPGISDNSSNVAGLLLCADLIKKLNLKTLNGGVEFVFNVGEETGLRGSEVFVKNNKNNIKEFYACDGHYNRIHTGATGFVIFEAEIITAGGHAWNNFGNTNAIAVMSEIVNKIYNIELPKIGDSKTTYNVGTFNGGHAYNAIAASCKSLIETRSNNNDCLNIMKEKIENILKENTKKDYNLQYKIKEHSPAIVLETNEQKILLNRRIEILKKYSKLPPRPDAAILDSNNALKAGIPATGMGIGIGRKTHSEEEYLEKESLKDGFTCFLATIFSYFET